MTPPSADAPPAGDAPSPPPVGDAAPSPLPAPPQDAPPAAPAPTGWAWFANTPSGLRTLLLLALAPPLLGAICAIPFRLFPSPALTSRAAIFLAAALAELLWLLLLLLAAARAGVRPRRPALPPLLIGLVLALGASYALLALETPLLRHFWGMTPDDLLRAQGPLAQLSALPPALRRLLLPGLVLVAPCAEELFFRGALQATTLRFLGPRCGLLVPALLFALLHTPLRVAFLPMLAFGLVTARLSLRHGIATTLPLHILYNALALLTAAPLP